MGQHQKKIVFFFAKQLKNAQKKKVA